MDLSTDLIERLVRMETKLDYMTTRLATNEGKLDQLEKAVLTPNRDHEDRIRKLEQFRWLLIGFAATGGGAVGAVVAQLLG